MDFKTIFQILLSSSSENDKIITKVAKISQGNRRVEKYGTPSIFTFNRLEIKTIVPNQVSIGVMLSNQEMNWLYNSIKSEQEQSFYRGRRLYIFNRIEPDMISVCAAENGKSFGILLNKTDIEILLANEVILEFFIKYQNSTSNTLKEITTELYVSVIGRAISGQLKSKCKACNTGEGTHLICNKYFKDMANKDILMDVVMADPEVNSKFSQSIHKLMNLLNISPGERIIQTQINLPEVKANKDLLIKKLQNFLDIKDGMGVIIEKVMNLIPKDENSDEMDIASSSAANN
jgi:hypothetical protein